MPFISFACRYVSCNGHVLVLLHFSTLCLLYSILVRLFALLGIRGLIGECSVTHSRWMKGALSSVVWLRELLGASQSVDREACQSLCTAWSSARPAYLMHQLCQARMPVLSRWSSKAGQNFLENHRPTSIDFCATHIWTDNWNVRFLSSFKLAFVTHKKALVFACWVCLLGLQSVPWTMHAMMQCTSIGYCLKACMCTSPSTHCTFACKQINLVCIVRPHRLWLHGAYLLASRSTAQLKRQTCRLLHSLGLCLPTPVCTSPSMSHFGVYPSFCFHVCNVHLLCTCPSFVGTKEPKIKQKKQCCR